MMCNEEEKKILKFYLKKIKSTNNKLLYIKFKLLIYYFPQLLERDRIKRLVDFLIKGNDDFLIRLDDYDSSIGFYIRLSGGIFYSLGNHYLSSKFFFEEFRV